MSLQEKIIYCRKKAGLSQEALAEQLSVSRQAISKWETGEATPEIGKLLLLAKVFNVTTDWLLSAEEPAEEKPNTEYDADRHPKTNPTWLDEVPGFIGRLLRKYGWLFGVYIAVFGAILTGMGILARVSVKFMFKSMNIGNATGQFPVFDDFYYQAQSGFANNNPVSIMGLVFIVVGILCMIAGIILAVVLKRRNRE